MEAVKGIAEKFLPSAVEGAKRPDKEEFTDTLKEFAGRVNEGLTEADRMAEAFAVGERYDLHEIMVASAKADLSLRLLLQVRNKALEAYQEIMRMQV